jgi:hypothetical protein
MLCPVIALRRGAGAGPVIRSHVPDAPASRRSYLTGLIAITVVVALVASLGAIENMAALIVLAVGLGIMWTVWRFRGGLSAVASTERDRFEALVDLCYGDRDMATRLVAAEGRRAPVRTRGELVDHAIERLREDRRR